MSERVKFTVAERRLLQVAGAAAIVGIAAVSFIWWAFGWEVAVAVFLVRWAERLDSRAERLWSGRL